MRLTGFPLIAASSVLLAVAASAASRPHYGGTLHVTMRAAPNSLDPTDFKAAEVGEAHDLSALMFDTLVVLDAQGRTEPGLATSWNNEAGSQRWRFMLRRGVTFQDGTPLNPEIVAQSLRKANSSWQVSIAAGAVVIETDAPSANLPAELALPRNSIALRENGKLQGSGPFVVSQWDPGKKLTLVARDGYWDGRPFVDSIEIEMGRNYRDQAMAFDVGRDQVVEVAPEQARRMTSAAGHVEISEPVELFALVFTHDPASTDESKLRDALSLSIDRELLNNVVLQGAGEPAGGLLPNWMSGYGFLFPSKRDVGQAQQLRAEVPQTGVWNVGYDPNDSVERVIAERIILNGRDAGLRLQVAANTAPDVQLVRVDLASLDPQVALAEIARTLGLAQSRFSGSSVTDLYAAENAMLATRRVIPLWHLRKAYAVSTSVRGWQMPRNGSLQLVNVWLGNGKP